MEPLFETSHAIRWLVVNVTRPIAPLAISEASAAVIDE
jgi:hypothetical protein